MITSFCGVELTGWILPTRTIPKVRKDRHGNTTKILPVGNRKVEPTRDFIRSERVKALNRGIVLNMRKSGYGTKRQENSNTQKPLPTVQPA